MLVCGGLHATAFRIFRPAGLNAGPAKAASAFGYARRHWDPRHARQATVGQAARMAALHSRPAAFGQHLVVRDPAAESALLAGMTSPVGDMISVLVAEMSGKNDFSW